ncbi:MAG: hypothetical protein COB38_10400 [Gammaproteobacteria bacterium]|nr:MAG: hypothetical protein COB38_10400 [Gammaproteobacteria bacterium]
MNKYEKLILLLIGVVLLGRLGILLIDIYVVNSYSLQAIPVHIRHLSLILSGSVNIGSCIWIFIEANKLNLKPWVWSLLGLFFGVIGLVLFYLIQVFTKQQSKEI